MEGFNEAVTNKAQDFFHMMTLCLILICLHFLDLFMPNVANVSARVKNVSFLAM
jgi:hypothetical protein